MAYESPTASGRETVQMDKLTQEQQIRAISLMCASQAHLSPSSYRSPRQVVMDAMEFEDYIDLGAQP